jgi:phage baseplate assembly protein W
MAVIDLNNLVRPKQINSTKTQVSDVVLKPNPIYVDLHLDLLESKNIGLGTNPVNSSDIVVDINQNAIKNSIKNIFNTRKGQKILNPDFGCSLDQYLFTNVSNSIGRAIGNDILEGFSRYEPRVKVTNVKVNPVPDQNLYYVSVDYTILQINIQDVINIIAKLGGEIFI